MVALLINKKEGDDAMDCPKCKEPMIFVNTDKRNGLIGHWVCGNEKCVTKGDATNAPR